MKCNQPMYSVLPVSFEIPDEDFSLNLSIYLPISFEIHISLKIPDEAYLINLP